MLVQDRTLVIRAPRRARIGWNESFAKMALRGDDKLLDPQPLPTQWDDEDWQWK